MTKLPTYEMVIDDNPESDVEVSFVALVDKPAIEKNFMAFNDVKLNFAVNEERQIISGPAMVADTLIYRRDVGGEYNVFFSKETIQEIALKFFKKDYQKNLNLFHDPALSLQGVTIFESFVSDKSRGVQPMKGFEDLPDGTWFISAKVENPDVWAKVKSGEVKGFSVEGIFSYVKKPKAMENQMAEIINRTLNPDSHIPEKAIMSKIKDFISNIKKELFDGTPITLPVTTPAPAPVPTPQTLNKDYVTKDGTEIEVDKLEVGGTALVNGMPAPAGEHELADGTKVTIGEGGVITAVAPVAMQTPQQQMQAVQAAVKKFATGTAEDRVANLEVVAKALMEYSFGWQIREQEQKAITDAAINVYKTKFESAEKKNTELEKSVTEQKTKLEKQEKQIIGMFEAIEKLAELPTGEPLEQTHLSFTKDKSQGKEAKRAALIAILQERKKAK